MYATITHNTQKDAPMIAILEYETGIMMTVRVYEHMKTRIIRYCANQKNGCSGL